MHENVSIQLHGLWPKKKKEKKFIQICNVKNPRLHFNELLKLSKYWTQLIQDLSFGYIYSQNLEKIQLYFNWIFNFVPHVLFNF